MSGWQEKAREAVAEHEFTDDTTQDTYGRDIERVGCLCGGWQWDSNDHECHERWWDHVLAALAPVVAAEVASAKAEVEQLRAEVAELEKPHQCAYAGMSVERCREAICDCFGGSTWPQRAMQAERDARAAEERAEVVEAEVRRGQAEALRDASEALAPLIDSQHPDAANPDQWLSDRADAIEAGDLR